MHQRDVRREYGSNHLQHNRPQLRVKTAANDPFPDASFLLSCAVWCVENAVDDPVNKKKRKPHGFDFSGAARRAAFPGLQFLKSNLQPVVAEVFEFGRGLFTCMACLNKFTHQHRFPRNARHAPKFHHLLTCHSKLLAYDVPSICTRFLVFGIIVRLIV